jgi:hypothetical protein
MAKAIITIIIVVVVGALVIQLVPFGRAHTNPPVTGEPRWDSAQTKALFDRACADCHSNQTAWPWYSNVAPVSWLVARDINEGRQRFNVSTWGSGENEGGHAAQLVREGEMPMPIYLMMHPDARLTAAEKDQLIQGLAATFGDEGPRGGGERRGDD